MFAQTLKFKRMELGITQQQLADRLFVSRQTVSSWETGRNLPNIDTLNLIAECLNVSPNYLLNGDAYFETSSLSSFSLMLLVIIRLGAATSTETLKRTDILIVLMLFFIAYTYFSKKLIRMKAPLGIGLGIVMILMSFFLNFKADFIFQLSYVVVGAILISENTFLFLKNRGRFNMKNKNWWIFNIVLGTVSIGLGILVLVRKVDGAGHIETVESKLIELLILLIFMGMILMIELIVHLILNKIRRI
ncbi:DUF3923 family protein [Pediococcus stilesii]|uniref:HTH cro/C1-type domain-containing protein n=1 Tax=Pediococcus stilesii TaxID=331679 RepID=A0A0R2L2U9_9LACO|nr:DUF3923 family protein [Pediococcus stilesii]KRN94181.1 hypothetical protein IV81_GL001595 [Pediococcus stilesii]